MTVRYSPAARADLREIERYYGQELDLPDAAKHILHSIVHQAHLLGDQPDLGFSLSSRLGAETPLRGLVAGRYLIVYSAQKEDIRIARVLDTRLDYIAVLLQES